MNRNFFIIFFFVLVASVFFSKTLFQGKIPFPGDLLLAEYQPWKSYSFSGFNPGSVPHKAQYFDSIRQMYPWKTFAIGELKKGKLPLWNPHNFSGSPLLANFQSAVFYPLNIVFLLFTQDIAWTVLIILQSLLSSIFMYLYAKKIGINLFGSVLGSISFGYSLYMTVFLEYNTIGQTLLWLPLILYGIEKTLETPGWKYIAISIIALTSSLFAGHLQVFGAVFILALIYSLCRLVSQNKSSKPRSSTVIVLLIFGLSLGIGAIQLVPTFESFELSARSNHTYSFIIEKLLIQPIQVLMVISPDIFGNPATRNYLWEDSYPGKSIYVGVVTLALSIYALLFAANSFYKRFFTASLIFTYLLITRNPLSELLYQLKIPLLSASAPSNFLFISSFSLTVLAGLGFSEFYNKVDKKFIRIVFVMAILLFVVAGFFKVLHIPFNVNNFLISLSFIIVILGLASLSNFLQNRSLVLPIGLIIVLILDLFFYFQKFNSFVPRVLMFPNTEISTWLKANTTIERIWGYGLASLQANTETQLDLNSPNGYDPLYPKRYGEFIHASQNGKMLKNFTDQTRSDAYISPGYGELDLSTNIYRKSIMDLIGVKYILDLEENGSTEKTFPPEEYQLVYNSDKWRIFKNLNSFPRVFLSDSYHVYKSNEEFESTFFNPLSTHKILLEEEPKIELQQLTDHETVNILVYEPNEIRIRSVTQGRNMLFLSDTYYPGWNVYIDGAKNKILRANYTFRSVIVPQGDHEVVFRYEPASLRKGVLISSVSLLAFVAVLIYTKIYFAKYERIY